MPVQTQRSKLADPEKQDAQQKCSHASKNVECAKRIALLVLIATLSAWATYGANARISTLAGLNNPGYNRMNPVLMVTHSNAPVLDFLATQRASQVGTLNLDSPATHIASQAGTLDLNLLANHRAFQNAAHAANQLPPITVKRVKRDLQDPRQSWKKSEK